MRINGHAHIFNLQTVLTTEAVTIIADRLRRNEFAKFVADGVKDFLLRQLERPQFLTEDGLLRELLLAIAKKADFKDFLTEQSTKAALPIELRLLGTTAETLGVEALRAALNQLSSLLDRHDGTGREIHDLFETLRLAMKPDIVSVADALLEQGANGSGLVALMMDIVATPEPARDRMNFLAQIRGTSDAALARPGRIFPFIAVNPMRGDHFAFMKRALEEQGFVGVKLYPSLGYEVTTPEMHRVVEFCVQNDTPILIHTTAGGFFKSEAATDFSHPRHWVALLRDFPSLRVCFGHCGGWGGFSKRDAAQVPWWDQIVAMMREHPNVYGDLSYHVEMRKTGEDEAEYFSSLKALLADQQLRGRIIFGTDSWLVRLSMSEEAYWKYFEQKLTAAEFTQIAELAPSKFLGLGTPLAGNMMRHLKWLEARADRVGRTPADWVTGASAVAFKPTFDDPVWSKGNRAHVLLYQFLRFSVKQIPKGLIGKGFVDGATIGLHQLGYFTKGHEPNQLFENRCRENAANLDAFFRAGGAGYEGDRTQPDVLNLLFEIFAAGALTLAQTGSALDSIYLFAEEIA
jgi:predicted TIM-barrel fold metal-dependent hydrolase